MLNFLNRFIFLNTIFFAGLCSSSLIASSASKDRIKIMIELTPYKKMKYQAPNQKMVAKWVEQNGFKRTLVARIKKKSHFFIDGYHFVVTPEKYIPQNGRFAYKFAALKKYGAKGKVEENLGHTIVSGLVEKRDSKGLYFDGTKTMVFRDDWGKPRLKIRVLPFLKTKIGSRAKTPRSINF